MKKLSSFLAEAQDYTRLDLSPLGGAFPGSTFSKYFEWKFNARVSGTWPKEQISVPANQMQRAMNLVMDIDNECGKAQKLMRSLKSGDKIVVDNGPSEKIHATFKSMKPANHHTTNFTSYYVSVELDQDVGHHKAGEEVVYTIIPGWRLLDKSAPVIVRA